MKFSLNNLKEFLITNANAQEIAQTLTSLGLEVEEVTSLSAGLEDFTVAKILSAAPHPDADKLQICQVETFSGVRQIVCGAPNARAGIMVALADIGAFIPASGITIKPAKIRGVESQGMLCSSDELGLGSDASGIIELPHDAQVGEKIIDVLGLNDVIFNIAITPNRGDCLGVYGIARDLAATGLGELKAIAPATLGQIPTTSLVSIESELCKHFIAYRIEGLTNGASPKWLEQTLKSLGQKSISALVDITNYFTLIYGRPLHVYDAQQLQGSLVVRESIQGEQFAALNGNQYELPDGACVIADGGQVQAIGGIIGGTNSGCSLQTTSIILESAWFEPIAIANSGRALKIDSDARYRFERGVDSASTALLAAKAAQMILELCGGTITAKCEAGSAPIIGTSFDFNPDYVNARLGMNVATDSQVSFLEKIGCKIENKLITPPSWRADISNMADIAEEIARLNGYDNLPIEPLPHKEISQAIQSKQDIIRKTMLARGLSEVVHFAFCARQHAEIFQTNAPLIEVLNPISNDLSVMRPHLFADLLQAVASNLARGNNNIAFGEIGSVFFGVEPNLAKQPNQAAGVRVGGNGIHWRGEKKFDLYSAKADLMEILSGLGVNIDSLTINRDVPNWYHPSASGRVSLGAKNILGYFGELHPAILRNFGIESKVFAFECWLDNVPPLKFKRKAAFNVCEFQASRRDFAFIAPSEMPANELQQAIKKAGGILVKSVNLFDVYAGDKIESGKKSLAFAVNLQAQDRTLTEADINEAYQSIVAAAEKLGAKLRL